MPKKKKKPKKLADLKWLAVKACTISGIPLKMKLDLDSISISLTSNDGKGNCLRTVDKVDQSIKH